MTDEKPRAYLVVHPHLVPKEAAIIDHGKALDYAARTHGVIEELYTKPKPAPKDPQQMELFSGD